MEYLDYGCRKITSNDISFFKELFPLETDGYIVYELQAINEKLVGAFVLNPYAFKCKDNFKGRSLGYVAREFAKEKASYFAE